MRSVRPQRNSGDSRAQPAPPATRRPLVVSALMLVMALAAIEGTIVATAMPSIVASLGGFELFSWVFSAFLLTQAITTPMFGKLADLFGRKPLLIVGVALFLLGSVLCALAQSMGMLIAFRFIQGMGAGAIYPIVSTLAADLYPIDERGKVHGYLASVWGVSAVVGPLLGGVFVEFLHWSWIFWFNVPFAIVSMLGIALYLHEGLEPKKRSIDFLGALLFFVSISAFMLVLTQGVRWGWPALVSLLGIGGVALWLFLHVERRAPEPLIPLDLWRDRMLVLANLLTLSAGLLMIALITYLPTYVQGVMGYPPVVAGFALTAMSIGWPLASLVAGRLIVPLGPGNTARIGGAAALVGGLMFVLMTPESGPLWAATGSFVVGMSMGFLMTTMVVTIQSSVPWERRGTATATNMLMRILGNAFGAALLGGVLNFSIRRSIARSEGASEVTLAGIERILSEPGASAELSPGLWTQLQSVLASGLHDVYLVVFFCALLTALLAALLPTSRRLD